MCEEERMIEEKVVSCVIYDNWMGVSSTAWRTPNMHFNYEFKILWTCFQDISNDCDEFDILFAEIHKFTK